MVTQYKDWIIVAGAAGAVIAGVILMSRDAEAVDEPEIDNGEFPPPVEFPQFVDDPFEAVLVSASDPAINVTLVNVPYTPSLPVLTATLVSDSDPAIDVTLVNVPYTPSLPSPLPLPVLTATLVSDSDPAIDVTLVNIPYTPPLTTGGHDPAGSQFRPRRHI